MAYWWAGVGEPWHLQPEKGNNSFYASFRTLIKSFIIKIIFHFSSSNLSHWRSDNSSACLLIYCNSVMPIWDSLSLFSFRFDTSHWILNSSSKSVHRWGSLVTYCFIIPDLIQSKMHSRLASPNIGHGAWAPQAANICSSCCAWIEIRWN